MLNWFGRYILAATAVAPIALAYSWAAVVQREYYVAAGLFLAAPALLLICHFQIRHARRTFQIVTISPKAAEATDRESVALIVLYLIPLFTYRFNDLQWSVIIPCMLLLGLIVSTGYNFYFSPLLGLLGWHSYRITDQAGITYVIITKRQLRSALAEFEVVQLTEYLVLEVPKRSAKAGGRESMPLNLFALCGEPGEAVVKRVMVSQDVQQRLEPFFAGLEEVFREGVDHEIDFDGRWKPDRDQLMRLPVTPEAQHIVGALGGDALAVEALQAANFENEEIRGLMVKESTGQHSRLLIQAFSNLQRLSRRFAVTLHGDVFNQLTQPTFAIDATIHIIIEGGFIKFKSFNMAKRVLDLSGAYREATDKDIVELCSLPRVSANADDIVAVANPTLRKLISAVKDSGVLTENTANEIHAKAQVVNLDIPVHNNRVVLPGDRAELRKILTFLDHGIYLSPVSSVRYITNSRRPLP